MSDVASLPLYYRSILKEFRKATQLFAWVHLFFALLLIGEIGLFLPLLGEIKPLALFLAMLFLTTFSYVLLLFYIQAKKPEKFEAIRDTFRKACETLLAHSPNGAEGKYLFISEALSNLSHYLKDFEWQIYKSPLIPRLLVHGLAPLHRKDVFQMKKLLLLSSLEELLKQIRLTPTDLAIHASLGHTYVFLSQIYREEMGKSPKPSFEMEEKRTHFAKLAVEEFTILSQYAPKDPWVHEQLAAGFRSLDLPEEEIREMELIHELCPQDKDLLFRLGKLYFEQGLNAKGLKVYEELQQGSYQSAEELISSYGKTPAIDL